MKRTLAVLAALLLAACQGEELLDDSVVQEPKEPVEEVTPERYAKLTWLQEQTREDESCFTLGEFNVYYGLSPSFYEYTYTVPVEEAVCRVTEEVNHCGPVLECSYTLEDMEVGSWYFSVTAVDTEGNESEHSNEAIKTIY